MRLLGNNLLTANMITINGGSISLPKERCLNQVAEQVVKFKEIDIDFTEAVSINTIGIVFRNQDLFTIKGNDVPDDWGSPAVTKTIEPGATNIGIDFFTSPLTYRYWQVSTASTSDFLGELYFGNYYQVPLEIFGSLKKNTRLDSVTEAVDGVKYVKDGFSRDSFSATLTSVNDTDFEEARNFYNSNGELPLICVLYEDLDNLTISKQLSPFWGNPLFDFGDRIERKSNNFTFTITEAK